MSRPPIKAMEAVKRYCEKNKYCKGCPLHRKDYSVFCATYPERWLIKKESERK